MSRTFSCEPIREADAAGKLQKAGMRWTESAGIRGGTNGVLMGVMFVLALLAALASLMAAAGGAGGIGVFGALAFGGFALFFAR
ncbi:hypothetical protein [uncultured Devosia sp.]|uniref:hypothetical protein n=1 Tax=uncultured Devosia sp. TaxID=211434 RepID=UPI00262F4D80|nr:hypothetical protein [uncultured Devosia sp.]